MGYTSTDCVLWVRRESNQKGRERDLVVMVWNEGRTILALNTSLVFGIF